MKFFSFFAAIISFAQDMKSTRRLVNTSLQYHITGGAGFQSGVNLENEAVLGVEGMVLSPKQYYSERVQRDEGLRLSARGYEFSIFLARYSRPETMSGFFWLMAGGYRKVAATFEHDPDRNASVLGSANGDGYTENTAVIDGSVGRLRLGYRQSVAQVLVGSFVGGSHFENQLRDQLNDGLTDDDRIRSKHALMTNVELGLEFGLQF